MADPPDHPYYVDSRGNRLDAWRAVPYGQGHHLWLRGTAQMADQVVLAQPDYGPTSLPAGSSPAWTHVLYSSRGLQQPVIGLLELLSRVVTLPAPSNVQCALALDWYKVPVDGVDPYQWANTETAQMVSLGKYRYKFDAERQASVGRDLCRRVCAAVQLHPALNAVDAVLDVPGHDASQVSFGPRMAATVVAIQLA